jgi:uncharacterized protein (DUF1778 family)
MPKAIRPTITLRFRSRKEFDKVKRAAKLEGLSLNTFVVGRANVGAEEVIVTRERVKEESQQQVA